MSQFWRAVALVLKFALVICSTVLLLGGVFSMGLNEIYVWYMMHSRSFIAAVFTFISLTLLLIITVYSAFTSSEKTVKEHFQPQSHLHDCDFGEHTEHEIAALVKAVKKIAAKLEAGTENKENMSFSRNAIRISQLGNLFELKEKSSITTEEYEKVKKLMIDDIVENLKLVADSICLKSKRAIIEQMK